MLDNIEDLYPDIVCPISKQVMKNPVITNNGISYEEIDILKWLEKKNICPITGEYLDFSWDRNLMIISKNVILENDKSSLKTDVIELDIRTKNVKIFMYDENKKINIKTLN